MKKLYNQWNGKTIYANNSKSKRTFAKFYDQFIDAVKEDFPDAEILNCHCGELFLYGFIRKNNKYVYFSYYAPKSGRTLDLNRSDEMAGVLYRPVRNETDFGCISSCNQFTNIKNFKRKVNQLLA